MYEENLTADTTKIEIKCVIIRRVVISATHVSPGWNIVISDDGDSELRHKSQQSCMIMGENELRVNMHCCFSALDVVRVDDQHDGRVLEMNKIPQVGSENRSM